jgi:hypothetical protein
MRRLFACFLFTLEFVAVCSGQSYSDRIVPLKDAPFSATVQKSETSRDNSRTWTTDIARAGNGSVYMATTAPVDEFEGSISSVTIHDAPSQCSTNIYPYISHLKPDGHGHMVRSGRGLNIGLSADDAFASPIPTVAEIRDRNLQRQQCSCLNPQHIPNVKLQQVSLGQRTVDGLTLYGFREEHATDSETGRVTDHIYEYWDSELGFTYSVLSAYPVEGRVSAHRLTGLKLAEPPAELFTLQEKYVPPTDIFSNARSVYVSQFVGHADLQQRITSILTASGRLSTVADSRTADLVVAVGPVHEPPNDPDPSATRQALIEFRAPDGRGLMRVTLRFKDASNDWAEEPVVNTCLASLWNRVESLHLSATATGEW